MKKKHSRAFNFEGKSFVYTVTVDYYNDPNYGADADGNRGMSVNFIEDINIDEIVDAHGEDVTEEMQDNPKVFEAINDDVLETCDI